MPTLSELETKWNGRLKEWGALGISVIGERVAREILDDLHAAEREIAIAAEAQTLSLTEAGQETGYHPGSIARLIKTNKVRNYGTRARPRVKLSELPRKTKRAGAGAIRAALVTSDSTHARAVESEIMLDAAASRLGRLHRKRS